MAYIEFCGLPASGKSTTLKVLKSAASQRKIPIRDVYKMTLLPWEDDKDLPNFVVSTDPRRYGRRLIEFRSRYPLLIHNIEKISGDRLNDLALFHEAGMGYMVTDAVSAPEIIYYSDEGFLNRSVHFFRLYLSQQKNIDDPTKISEQDLNLFSNIIDDIPKMNAMIWQKTTPATAITRMVDRRMLSKNIPEKRREKIEQKLMKSYGDITAFTLQASLFEFGLERLKQRGLEVVEVCPSDDVELKMKNLLDNIKNITT